MTPLSPLSHPHPSQSAAISAAALSDLALRLHTAGDKAALAEELGQGLKRLHLWFALYVSEAEAHQMLLCGQALPGSLEFPPRLGIDVTETVNLLAGPPRLLPLGSEPLSVDSAFGSADPLPPRGGGLGRGGALRKERDRTAGRWAVLPLRGVMARPGLLLVLGQHLSEEDLSLLGRLAEQLTIALDRLHALSRVRALDQRRAEDLARYEQMARRTGELGTSHEGGGAPNAIVMAGGLVPWIAESAARLLGAEYSVVSLEDESIGGLAPIYRWPEAEVDIQGYPVDIVPGVVSSIAVPLLTNDRIVGQIEVSSARDHAFAEEDRRLLVAFAIQARAAMECSQLIQQLADGKHTWEETFDAISDGICVRDHTCRIVQANQTLAQFVGRPVNQIIGQRLCDQLPQLQPSCNVCNPRDMWDEEQAEILDQAADLVIDGPQPRLLSVKDSPARVADEGIVLWVTIIEDVTSKRRSQDALVRSERMQVIGEMASGVAHDFNNLLAVILHRSELSLLADLPDGARRSLETINRAALDGVATVRRIQEYSRVRRDLEERPTDLTDILEAAIDLARHKWRDAPLRVGATIRVQTDLATLPPVLGNASELREVFVNLIFNAVDAMPGGGAITIRTAVSDDQAVVEVSDTGAGMTKELQERIFDPFFTTKGESGSGLGLSVSQGIIDRHGGEMSVASTVGEGTTFTLRLPLAAAAPQASSIEIEPQVEQTPPMRILLVDDNTDVREAVADLLERDGHHVSAFSEGRLALSSYRPGHFDCLITDLGMPDFDGWEFARELRAIDATVPLILMSGWRSEITDEQVQAHGVSAVLPKPCTPSGLRDAIASLTTAASAGMRQAPRPAATGKMGAPAAMRVLVVDDQELFAEALADRLRLDGYEVTTALSGQAGIRAAESEDFHLAIVDLGLPDISGAEVARQIRGFPYSPYVVLTSGLALEAGDPAWMGSADDVLPKPCQASELQAVLDKARERTLVAAGVTGEADH